MKTEAVKEEETEEGVRNYALDFDGTRTDLRAENLEHIDVSGIAGTHLFCRKEAQDALRKILQERGIRV